MAIRYLSGVNIDSNTLFVDDVNNRVGIGTGSPNRLLQVAGSVYINTNLDVIGTIYGSTNKMLDQSATYTRLYDAAGTLVVSIGSGNVGIGTASPAQKLDISQGSIFLSGSGSKYLYIRRYDGLGTHSFGVGSDEKLILSLSGSNPFIIDGGNVGIGTTSPSGELHIKSSSSNANLYIQRSTYDAWRLSAGSTYLGFMQDTSEKMRITADGNVGIGTDSPGSRLQVKDSQDSSFDSGIGIIRSNSTQTGYINMVGGAMNINAPSGIPIKLRDGGATNVTISGDGNVGIGTTSPAYKVDVLVPNSSGDTKQNVQQWGQLNQNTLQLNMYGGSTDLVQFAATNAEQNISIVTEASGSLTAATSKGIYIKSGGNVGIGTTSPTQKLHVNGGNVAIDNSSDVSLIFAKSGVSKYEWYLDNASNNFGLYDRGNLSWRFFVTNSGNVGIGTTSPSEKLEVAGNAILDASNARLKIKGGITGTNSGIDWTFNSDTTQYAKIELDYDTRNTTGLLIDSGYPMTLDYSAGSFSIKKNGTSELTVLNGNVGIGTTNPGREFVVSKTSGDSHISIIASSTEQAILLMGDSDNDAQGQIRYDNTDDSLQVRVNASEKLRITSAGNVGIGTTAPGARLVVQSGASSSEPTMFVQSGTSGVYGMIAASDPYHGLIMRGIPSNATTYGVTAQDSMSFFEYGGDFRFYEKTNIGPTLNEIARINKTTSFFNSNVGIGTTSPGGQLSIFDTNNSRAYQMSFGYETTETFRLGNNNATGKFTFTQLNNSNGFRFTSVAPNSTGIIFDINTTQLAVNGDTGNVGIGTTEPAYKLDVSGNVRSSLEIISNSYIKSTGGSVVRSEFNSSNFSQLESNSSGGLITGRAGGTTTLSLSSYTNSYFNGGNVGIGTTAPTNRLTVTTGTNAVDVLRLNNTGGDSGAVQGVTHLAINHFNSGTNPSTRITAYQDSTSGWPGGMYFSTRSLNTDSAPLERMRITSAGNVGIGTTDPQYMLDVNGDAQINAEGTGPAYAYVPDGGFGVDSLLTSGVENVALGKPDVWLRIHVDGVAFVFPGYQEP